MNIMTRHVHEDWKLEKLGQLFEERKEKVSDKEFVPLSVTKRGIVPQMEHVAKSDDSDNRKRVAAGDFVINSRSDRRGSSGVSYLDGSVSLINMVLKPRHGHPGFLHHLLRSYAFQEEFYRFGHGIVADLWTTRYSELKGITVALPDEQTQKEIAGFLDHETIRIDQLIEKKSNFVNLLFERRAANINTEICANPHSSQLKSSPLKYLCQISGGGTPSKDNLEFWTGGSIPWVSPKDMKQPIITTTEDFITEKAVQDSATSYVSSNCVLMVVRSGILRHSIPLAISGVRLTLNQDMKALKFSKKVLPEYFIFWVKGQEQKLLLEWRHMGATVESIDTARLMNSRLSVPSLEDQKKIISRIQAYNIRIDQIIEKTNTSILALKQFRTALITEAVTGQLDIEAWKKKGGTDKRLDNIEEAMRA